MSGENDRRSLLANAVRHGARSFGEQFTPSKDQLREMLADAAKNTAALSSPQTQPSDHQS